MALGFVGFEPFLHGLQIVALADARTPAGETEWPSLRSSLAMRI
jgi:hypothetical protein